MTYNAYASAAYAPKTQKAKSLHALRSSNYKVPQFTINSAKYYEEHPEALCELIGKFVRPCPIVPRHGFVDSRPVHTREVAEQLIREAIAAEPDAEIIAMPFIASKFSAIFTTGNLIIGPGNDGATLGVDCQVIPLVSSAHPGDSFQWMCAQKEAGISESPFVEMLFSETFQNEYSTQFVQLRNGPKIPSVTDWIPQTFKVTNVVLARGENGRLFDAAGKEIDLLEWENIAKELGKQSGVVVYHPNGSLASHCAVHCVINNVPVVTTFKPEIGITLEQTATKKEIDVNKLRAGFVFGCSAEMTYSQAAYVMLSAGHNVAAWMGTADALIGFGMGCAYRLTVAAGLGEFRHRKHIVCHNGPSKYSRNAVYKNCWNKILTPSTRQRFVKAIKSFSTEYWGGSFGGKKWAAFCMFSAEMFNGVLKGDSNKAVLAFHDVIHAAHNGGWAFDKFISESAMSAAEQNPFTAVMHVPVILYTAAKEIQSRPELADWFKYRCEFETNSIIDKNKYNNPACESDEPEEYESNESDEPEESEEYSANPHNFNTYPVIKAHGLIKNNVLHIQYIVEYQSTLGCDYLKLDVPIASYQLEHVKTVLENCANEKSYASDSNTQYKAAEIDSAHIIKFDGWYVNLKTKSM